MKRSPPPARKTPLQPGGPLKRSVPLASHTPLQRSGSSPAKPAAAKPARDTGPSRTVRRIVRARSGGWCERCGLRPAVQIHHRRPRRAGGSTAPDTNRPANLLHLCTVDHDWVEAHRTAALAAGLLLHAGDDPAAVPVQTAHNPAPVLLDDAGSWTVAA